MATAEAGANVLSATTYSKSVLRVAAEMMRRQHTNVHYFPSYEIIMGSFNRGAYFATDLRNVVEAGVNHVMSLFLKHATDGDSESGSACLAEEKKTPRPGDRSSEEILRRSQELIEVECDEAALDRE